MHTTKWIMYKWESVLDNETHEILGDHERQTENQIPATRADLMILNKKERTERIEGFVVLAYNCVEIRKSKTVKST